MIEDRVTELEIRYTHQEDLVQQLSDELYKATSRIDALVEKVRALEATLQQVAESEPLPPSEKPPHY